MPNVRYVCLSDLHFGEEDSLLTKVRGEMRAGTGGAGGSSSAGPGGSGGARLTTSEALREVHYGAVDTSAPSEVMVGLVECLRHVISKNDDPTRPTLILNGDILELALSTTGTAGAVFARFIELLMRPEPGLFDRIVYIPGNHDHHVWELARETQYEKYGKPDRVGDKLAEPYHNTKMFAPKDLSSGLIDTLVKFASTVRCPPINVAYPNFGILSHDGRKCVIIHHGHLAEPIYQMMSKIATWLFPGRDEPTQVWQIEGENFAWIDFFWSALGRSGDVGLRTEAVYERRADERETKKLISNLADGIAREYDIPHIPGFAEPALLRKILTELLKSGTGRERHKTDQDLSSQARTSLSGYLTGPLREQMREERSGVVPGQVTFVFGHTHKPLQSDMEFRGFYDTWVNVYNTGGWVVDSVDPQPTFGAAAVLVDENLDAVSLRLYRDGEAPTQYAVAESVRPGEPEGGFCKRIRSLVDPSRPPWSTLSAEVDRAAHARRRSLEQRIHMKT